jgi:hypothetical protein
MRMARGALASAIYKKTTQFKISVADDSAALTLMSTDVERIRLLKFARLLGLHHRDRSSVVAVV